MTKRSVLFLYHIPKTAGQSVRHALMEGLTLHEGFFQVGPFGDKRSRQEGVPTFQERTPEQLRSARVVAGHYLSAAMREKLPDASIASAIVLRDPATRLVSQYNHAMFTRTKRCGLPVLDFEEWYAKDAVPMFPWESLAGHALEPREVVRTLASVGDDYMAKFVLHAHGDRGYPEYDPDTLQQRATAILDGFEHVGALEDMGRTETFLSAFLDRDLDLRPRNVAGRKRPRFVSLSEDLRRWIEERNRVDVELCRRYASGS